MATSPGPLPAQDDVPADVLIPSVPQWLATALIGTSMVETFSRRSRSGPCMAGYQTALILFGMYLQAMLRYVATGEIKQHGRLAQCTLYLMLLLNLIYIGLTFQETYASGVSNDRTFDSVYTGTIQWQFLPWCNGIIGSVAEAFLTIRAASFFTNRLARNGFYVWMGALVTLVLFGSTMVFAIGIMLLRDYVEEDLPLGWNTAVAIWLWASTAADVSITVALAFNLRKRIAGFNQGTDTLLRKLIWLSMRTASYTALLSLIGAIVASVWNDSDLKTTEVQIAFWFPIAPLYGLSLITTTSSGRKMINARLGSSSHHGNGLQGGEGISGVFAPNTRSFGLRGPGTFATGANPTSGGGGSGTASAASADTASARRGIGGRAAPPLQIKVEREVVLEVDDFDTDMSALSGTTGPRVESIHLHEKARTRFET